MSRTVIFDFGAVLFRWQPLDLLQQALPEFAPDESAARSLATLLFQSFAPHSDWSRFDLGLIGEAELAQRLASRTGLPVQATAHVIQAALEHLVAMPASVALMQALKADGHRVFYLSNMPAPYAAQLERNNPFIAAFDGGIFSGRVGLMKPWPAMFELAQHRFGLQPGSPPLFIDDHAGNIAACQQHGWHGLHFVDATQARTELLQHGWLSPGR